MSKVKVESPGSASLRSKRKADALNDKPHHQRKKSATAKSVTSRPVQTHYDEKISQMGPSLLSDHFAKSTQRLFPESSFIELEDKYVPTKAFSETSSFMEPRLTKHLPSFLKQFATGGEAGLSSCDEIASPHTIVVASSAIRATDLVRELRAFSTEESKVAKLFSKHLKLKDNIAFVEKTKFGFGVGTPNRLNELFARDVMKLDKLRRIVIDGSYIDEKKRTIFDMKEVFSPLIDLLNRETIKSRYGRTVTLLVF